MHLDMREKFFEEGAAQLDLPQAGAQTVLSRCSAPVRPVGWLAARQATQVHLSFAEVSQLHFWDVQEPA
jgi:hypothetical protein